MALFDVSDIIIAVTLIVNALALWSTKLQQNSGNDDAFYTQVHYRLNLLLQGMKHGFEDASYAMYLQLPFE
eukprot:gene5713-11536_t